ncbi:MAG: hypothetical protein ACK4Y5_20735 [Acetobacteraceae bacterium]|jgi:hypothetical protein|nr:hypothetical protein [Cyanobium sp. 49614_E6]
MDDNNIRLKMARFESLSDQAHSHFTGSGDFKKLPTAYVQPIAEMCGMGLGLMAALIQKMQATVLDDPHDDKTTASAIRCMEKAGAIIESAEGLVLETARSWAKLPYKDSPLRHSTTEMTFENMSDDEKLLRALRSIMLAMVQVHRSWVVPAQQQTMLEATGQLIKSEMVDPASFPPDPDDEAEGGLS